jgi:glycosyltransferase involved in cell wall biosynthesis
MAEECDKVVSPSAALPRTAVVICTHNGERFVREQLESIDEQSLPVGEIHIFDWNSSDGTVATVRRWADAGSERRGTVVMRRRWRQDLQSAFCGPCQQCSATAAPS